MSCEAVQSSALVFAYASYFYDVLPEFLKSLRLAWRMAHRADRPLPFHLVYLAEACRMLPWLESACVEHLHAHFGTNSAEVAMFVHTLGGPEWSFTVHGPEEFDKPEFIGLAEKIRHCAFVVAISSYGRSQLYRLVEKSLWSKVHVIHCGLEIDHLGALSECATVDTTLGLRG